MSAKPDAPGSFQSVASLASRGIFWSLIQNWGAKFSTFFIFVLLARFLTPAEYGLAAAALSVLMLIGLVAEFGFGDAVVQRRNLLPREVNLPFFVALAAASVLALLAALLAGQIEGYLNSPGLAVVIVGVVAVAPLTTISLFQEMNYRRQMEFKALAFRVLISNVVAGAVAVMLAFMGAGVWSLVAQSYIAVLISIAWLWSRPKWVPSRDLDRRSFGELGRFGASVVSMRLLDFGATRLVEVLIVGRYGIAVLGLYAVGSRLYQVLMQLLQSALNDVSLTVLSRIADDRERMGRIYLQATMIAAYIAAPVFVACAALAPQICLILFDQHWVGVDVVARPLLLLGAVQSVQYLNGAYLSARGRPNVVLMIAAIKYGLMILGLLLVPTDGVAALVTLFAVLQLVATPLSFEVVRRELGLSWGAILATLSPSVIACAAGYAAVAGLQAYLPPIENLYLALMAWGGVFGVAFVIVTAVVGRSQVVQIYRFVRARLEERKVAGKATAASTDGAPI